MPYPFRPFPGFARRPRMDANAAANNAAQLPGSDNGGGGVFSGSRAFYGEMPDQFNDITGMVGPYLPTSPSQTMIERYGPLQPYLPTSPSQAMIDLYGPQPQLGHVIPTTTPTTTDPGLTVGNFNAQSALASLRDRYRQSIAQRNNVPSTPTSGQYAGIVGGLGANGGAGTFNGGQYAGGAYSAGLNAGGPIGEFAASIIRQHQLH